MPTLAELNKAAARQNIPVETDAEEVVINIQYLISHILFRDIERMTDMAKLSKHLTGFAQDLSNDIIQACNFGADGLVEKPFSTTYIQSRKGEWAEMIKPIEQVEIFLSALQGVYAMRESLDDAIGRGVILPAKSFDQRREAKRVVGMAMKTILDLPHYRVDELMSQIARSGKMPWIKAVLIKSYFKADVETHYQAAQKKALELGPDIAASDSGAAIPRKPSGHKPRSAGGIGAV